ncbi:hypothetical protein RJ639_033025 [Escallonia herrerae]|uniref:Transmembrane protein n=1 Tax=Escallonia herrerae TaxID=1293975 RepID=A0AA88X2S8_9ASTE|nr:hypothetical protein RJ639_033025 [Escallonia herrerae]
MSDWGPIFVAVLLFVLLSPGLLFQLPGRNGYVDFGNFHTSGAAIMVHALLYFALICVFLLALRKFSIITNPHGPYQATREKILNQESLPPESQKSLEV